MLIKSSAIDRLLRENPELGERRFGLPNIGLRDDGDKFNPTVQSIADAIDFYGYEVRDENITTIPDIDLGSGNPTKYPPFPLSINEMKKSGSINVEMIEIKKIQEKSVGFLTISTSTCGEYNTIFCC